MERRRANLDEIAVPGICGHAEVVITLLLQALSMGYWYCDAEKFAGYLSCVPPEDVS